MLDGVFAVAAGWHAKYAHATWLVLAIIGLC
jgi:hypothetical protein